MKRSVPYGFAATTPASAGLARTHTIEPTSNRTTGGGD
jgi:hypothetical protein